MTNIVFAVREAYVKEIPAGSYQAVVRYSPSNWGNIKMDIQFDPLEPSGDPPYVPQPLPHLSDDNLRMIQSYVLAHANCTALPDKTKHLGRLLQMVDGLIEVSRQKATEQLTKVVDEQVQVTLRLQQTADDLQKEVLHYEQRADQFRTSYEALLASVAGKHDQTKPAPTGPSSPSPEPISDMPAILDRVQGMLMATVDNVMARLNQKWQVTLEFEDGGIVTSEVEAPTAARARDLAIQDARMGQKGPQMNSFLHRWHVHPVK